MPSLRYISLLMLHTVLLTGCGKGTPTSTSSDWKPPNKPNPQEILNEARADARSGHYSVALAKQVWFHENALKHDPALAGVRLSFALSYWMKLGSDYPTALEKLKAIRDEAGENIQNKAGRKVYETFMDFAAINKALKEDLKTKELFVWLDSNRPDMAKQLFNLAEAALVKSKEYRLCGKYANAETSFATALRNYRTTSEIAKRPNHGKKLQDYADKKFVNETTTLIALLVVNDRRAEAQKIVDEISKQSDVPKFEIEIQRALRGDVPAPWP